MRDIADLRYLPKIMRLVRIALPESDVDDTGIALAVSAACDEMLHEPLNAHMLNWFDELVRRTTERVRNLQPTSVIQ